MHATPAPEKKYGILNSAIDIGKRSEAFSVITNAFGGDDLSGRSFEVIDFLQALPQLDGRLADVNGTSTAVEVTVIPLAMRKVEADYEIVASCTAIPNLSEGHLRDKIAVYPYLSSKNLAIVSDPADVGRNAFSWRTARFASDELNAITVEMAGRRYMLPTVRGLKVPEFSMYLGVLFVLGYFARYYPDYWLDMIEKQSDEYFLIRDFIDTAADNVPHLVLNHLSRRTFLFRTI